MTLVYLLALFALSIMVLTGGTLPQTQMMALERLSNSANGVGWYYECKRSFANLKSSTTIDILDLKNCRLRGSIPTEIGFLTKLQKLDLSGNELKGSIPTEIGTLTDLVYIDLSYNSLADFIPSEIGALTSLTWLALTRNSLSSSLPSELGYLTKLKVLQLGENGLTGSLPPTLWKMTALSTLDLHMNCLRGTVPSEAGLLTDLRVLDLNYNSFNGALPSELWLLTNLTALLLRNNRLTNRLSTSIGNLRALTQFDVSSNSFNGSIPSEIGNVNKLKFLQLSNNTFSSTIPCEIGRIASLQVLALTANKLDGSLPDEIGKLSNLIALNCSDNSLRGTLPSNLSSLRNLTQISADGNYFSGSLDVLSSLIAILIVNVSNNLFTSTVPIIPKIIVLDASDNKLSGSLPNLTRLTTIETLILSKNNFIGEFPSQWCNLSSIKSIDLSNNLLSGGLPSCMESMGNLATLALAYNRFTGTLDSLSTLRNLTAVDLSSNEFVGTLPSKIFESNPGLLTFAAASNCLKGAIPNPGICQATSLQTLVLDGLSASKSCQILLFPDKNAFGFTGTKTRFKIQGKLPICLFSALQSIETLHLSGNGLTGSLPSKLRSWPVNLTDLSLSHNRLTGPIPLQKGLTQFEIFDVAFNHFNGELGSVLTLPSSQAKLDMRVNRFSGILPPSIVQAENVQILEGNLIDCTSKSELPKSDPYIKRFKCGSDTLNNFMIAFTILIVIYSSVFVFYFRSTTNCISWADLRSRLDPEIQIGNSTVPSTVILFLTSLQSIRRFVSKIAAVFLAVLLPIYGITSALQGTHKELYAWAISAGFKSGLGSAGVFMVTWVILLQGLHYHLASKYWATGIKQRTETSQESPILQLSPASNKQSPQMFYLRALLLLRLLCIIIIDFFCIVTPNVGYVQVVTTQSSAEQMATGLALSVYKMIWSWSVFPRILTSQILMFGVTDEDVTANGLESWKGGFVFELALRAFNAVVAPTVALLSVDSNCLSEALYAPQPIEASYISKSSIKGSGRYYLDENQIRIQETILPFIIKREVSYEPSFQYGYQCSSALIQTYGPVFLLMALLSCFGEPLLHLALRFVASSEELVGPFGVYAKRFCLKLMPKVMMTSSELSEWTERHRGPIESDRDRSHSNRIINVRSIVMTILQDLLIFLTFGLTTPLLGLVVAASLTTRTLRMHYLIHGFLDRGGAAAAIAEDCRELSEQPHPLYTARWFLVSFAAIFLLFFLIDTAGDSVGVKASIWAPLLMLILPLSFGVLLERRLKKFSLQTTDTRSTFDEVELSAVYGGSAIGKSVSRSSLRSFSMEEARASGSTTSIDKGRASDERVTISSTVLQDHIPPTLGQLQQHQRDDSMNPEMPHSPIHHVTNRLSPTSTL